ncbi:glycoside hydrolase family 127 protein [Phytohabitans sp. ZYX-F-186]|uniref:Glycoside hydrolase family 127 protein n=1 Tax=Phytohabitans maris TaxID=3071409 RepID=A0ABU0ZMJ6_9ACTN|nr:beta-L-arabinofuranosidase domain-containing protein [Phytohabitans sp. ZYX-F-186]MDQ7907505.1 glycoside hydrolase family 127 protein [Phytohabitans sp. ZYX-F-186]
MKVRITDGFWADRLRLNRTRTIPHGFEQLRRSGVLDNLRMAAGAQGRYQAYSDSAGTGLKFLDSDVYKWLEAAGWELGRGADEGLAAAADEAIGVVAKAQRADGYVNSFVQVVGGGTPHRDLAWGHEFYCVGHLIQAGIAWHRALGDDRLLSIARRAAGRVDEEFGPGRRDGVDGHPGIEMALVELTRVTGERRYLDLAARLLDLRGRGLLGAERFGAAYWQDHATVRQAATVAGHAVRQLYLDCGAVDVAVELGDEELLAAVRRRWDDLIRTRTYLTGGMGSRHRDEAFGDPFELPPDRAYAETCAAIASVMLAWRLLLATGDVSYGDAIERAMFNGVLSGISLGGTSFFYTNPLQRRTSRTYEPPGHSERAPWYPCACCPPNLMRLLSSWERYQATSDGTGVRLHQYATSEISTGDVALSVRTDYPWQGRVTVHIGRTPDEAWTLALRVPAWCTSATVAGPDGIRDAGPGPVELSRRWRAGDTVVLDLDLRVRATEPDPRIDAVRGCVAVERGPIVYCVESDDLPPAIQLEELTWDPDRRPVTVARPDVGAAVGVRIPVRAPGRDGELVAGAIPYFAWGNRRADGMRVWIPR